MSLRSVLLGTLGVILLIIIGVGATLYLDGGPLLAWALEHPVSSMTGRRIVIGGPMSVKWGGWTRLIVNNLQVANASWGTAPDMFSAQRLEIVFAPKSLISGPIRVALIDIYGGKLLLETSSSGQKNWEFGPAKATVPSHRGRFPILAKFVAQRSAFYFYNGETGARNNLQVDALTFDEPNPTTRVTFAGRGIYQHQPLRIEGSVGPLAQLRNPSLPYPISVRGRYALARLAIGGTAKKPLDFAGLDLRISLTGRRLSDVAEALGVPLPTLPRFRGTAILTGGNGLYNLGGLSLKLGRSDVEGGIDVNTNQKIPYLHANLTSHFLDLANFKGLYGGNPKGAAPTHPTVSANGKVAPKTRVEVGKLPGINADLSFYGTNIANAGGTHLERVALGLHLKNGQLTIDPLKFHMANGNVALHAVYTPVPKGPPELRGEIDVEHVDLHRLLDSPSYPAMVRRTAGIAGGRLDIKSTGLSPRELMAHMSGGLSFVIENGQMSDLLQQLADLNVLKALGVYLSGDRQVTINCAVADLGVVDGFAKVKTFLIDTDQSRIMGVGDINLARENMHLTLVPRNKHLTILTLNSPIKITGTFHKPSFSIVSNFPTTRIGRVETLAVVPPAALLATVAPGVGQQNMCEKVFHPPPQQQSELPPRGQ